MAGAVIWDVGWRIILQGSSFTWIDKLVLVVGGRYSHSPGGPLHRTTRWPWVCCPPPKWMIQDGKKLYPFNDLTSEVTWHPFRYNLFMRSKSLSPAFFNWARGKQNFMQRPTKQISLIGKLITSQMGSIFWSGGWWSRNQWTYFKVTTFSI